MAQLGIHKHWVTLKPYLVALGIFAGSRVIVFLAMVFSSKFVERAVGEIFNDVTPQWYRHLLHWDSAWYLRIATEGYSYNGDDLLQQPVVFYPFYPLISKVLAQVFRISEAGSLLVISTIAICFAIPLLFKLIRESHSDETAYYSVAAISFFPSSLFFSAGYTESLALLLIVGFFLLLKRGHFISAAVLAGLAVGTRSTGLVLLIPLVIELWRAFSRDLKRLALVSVPCLILATSGLWIYMFYLWAAFRSPFAFLTDTRAWSVGAPTGNHLFELLTLQPFRHLKDVYTYGPDPNTLSAWFFILFVVLLITFRKRLALSLWGYSAGVLLLPYVTLSTNVGFVSFTRYLLMAFPVFIILGESFKRRPWLGVSVIGIFSAMLFMYTAFYTQWYWAG